MKLLLAVDLTEAFEPCFEQAIAWAERLDATLDLVFVGVYDDLHQFVTDPHVRTLLAAESEKIRAAHAADLKKLLMKVPEAHRGSYHTPAGPPAHAITSMEDDYDALLLATHGRQGLAHLWLGSVAERVVRTSKKPVIVLRLPHAPA